MARKRSRKKQEKLRGELAVRLEELYLRGEDERFLELAWEGQRELGPGELARRWDEVVERCCRRALAAADLPRLAGLLGRRRRGASASPLVRLAEAVVALAAGRRGEAREALTSLASAGSLPEELSGRLLPALLAVAGGGEPPPPGLPAEVEDLLHLAAAARDLTAGTLAAPRPRSAPRPALRQAAARAVGDLLAGLATLEREGEEVSPGTVKRLQGAAAALAEASPGGKLGPRLRQLQEELALLAELVTRGRRRRGGQITAESGGLAAWLEGSAGRRLERSVTAAAPLLAPVRSAIRRRWRGLLAQVAQQEGGRGLGALVAARPALLAADLEVARPGATAAGVEALRQGVLARQLLAGGEWGRLADWLRAESSRESDPGRLAALWSLELWARECQEQAEPEVEEAESAEPPCHRALVRLGEMAEGVGRRFPPEHRPQVARVLRDELVSLLEQNSFCDHALRAARTLAGPLPDDAALLIAGLAAAVVAGDGRARRAAEGRLARRGKLRQEEPEVARRLLAQLAMEDPVHLGQVLPSVEPLLAGEDWQEIREVVARQMEGGFGWILTDAADFAAAGEEELAEQALAGGRRRAAALRPWLAGTPGLAGVELALAAWSAPPDGARRETRRFAAASPQLPSLLSALRLLDAAQGPASPPGVEAAVAELAPAAIRQLDRRWQLWLDALPLLAMAGGGRYAERLRRKLAELARKADGADREGLEAAREAVGQMLHLHRGLAGAAWGPPVLDLPFLPEAGEAHRQPKRRRRRRSDHDQLSLDFG